MPVEDEATSKWSEKCISWKYVLTKLTNRKFNVWLGYILEATENKALKGHCVRINNLILKGSVLNHWFLQVL